MSELSELAIIESWWTLSSIFLYAFYQMKDFSIIGSIVATNLVPGRDIVYSGPRKQGVQGRESLMVEEVEW